MVNQCPTYSQPGKKDSPNSSKVVYLSGTDLLLIREVAEAAGEWK
ncbi:MAG: hypothetical protein U9532_01545 ['Conium maculatum' witches'-broom phytoplasma]|nr:hypothetical protein ['Conium maculatum' witches'-broom phytoplasma]